MPGPLFPNGLPTTQLNDVARRVADQLDTSPFIERAEPTDRGDGLLSRAEVRAGLAALDNFNPEERAAIEQMARILGVAGASTPGSAPVKPANREWLDRETPPEGLSHARTAVAIGGFVYVQDDAYNMRTSGLLRYDVKSDQWSELSLPDGFRDRVTNISDGWRNTSFTEAGGQLYMVGGAASRQHVAWAYRYDPGQKQWHRIANMTPRSAIALAGTPDGKVYAFGGTHEVDDPRDPGRPADGGVGAFVRAMGGNAGPARMLRKKINVPSTVAQAYDPSSNTWSDLPAMPVARRHAKAIAVDGKLYVIGGTDDGHKRLNRVDVFDPGTGQWRDPPLRMPTALNDPTLWLEDGKIHVSGGESEGTSNRRGCNTVHEILDPATGGVTDGPTLRAPDGASNLQVANSGGRLFAVGGTELDRTDKAFLYEFAAPAPASAGDVLTLITNNNTTNNTTVVHVDLDIRSVLNTITNITPVTVVNNTVVDNSVTNNIRVNAHVHNNTNTVINVDVPVLQAMSSSRQSGYFDPDNGFFLRTMAGDEHLLSTGTGRDGTRRLLGQTHAGMAAAPKQRDDLFLYHPATSTLVPFSSDSRGQFVIDLPEAVHGEVLVFASDGRSGSGAATLEIP